MEEILVVFKNRNDSMQFASYLKRMGVRCSTVNTPRELSISCGLSVTFFSKNIEQAKYVVSRHNFSDSVSFFRIKNEIFSKKYFPFSI